MHSRADLLGIFLSAETATNKKSKNLYLKENKVSGR